MTDPQSTRLLQVDLMKAVGILAVVLIHSVRPIFSADASTAEAQLALTLRFAVPGFLAASGYLYALSRPASAADTRRRLRRILLPYLVASAGAQLFWLALDGRAIELGTLAEEIALGSSFGPYYYVPIAVLCVLLAPGLSRLGPRALAVSTAAGLIAQWLLWTLPVLPLFWALRNPLPWLGFFLGGWWLGTREPGATRWLVRHRNALWMACGVGFVLTRILGAALAGPYVVKALLLTLSVWLALSLIATLGAGRSREHRFVRRLSDSTYTIYLFHLFFVFPLQRIVPSAPGVFDPVAIGLSWVVGVTGPLALAAAGRVLLGPPRSRLLLGS